MLLCRHAVAFPGSMNKRSDFCYLPASLMSQFPTVCIPGSLPLLLAQQLLQNTALGTNSSHLHRSAEEKCLVFQDSLRLKGPSNTSAFEITLHLPVAPCAQ